MPCYFPSVTALLLIRTDTIFRQSGIFKLMVPLNFFFWLSLLFMAQEFAVTYLDSAKVLHVHGFKYMLKPVWSVNMGLLLSLEPHEECLELLISSQGGSMCKLTSAAETEYMRVKCGSGVRAQLTQGTCEHSLESRWH